MIFARATMHLPPVLALFAGFALARCGGKVNVGEDRPLVDTSGSAMDDGAELTPGSTLVIRFTEGVSITDLTLVNEYLYLLARQDATVGLYRCKKDACASSVLRLPVPGSGMPYQITAGGTALVMDLDHSLATCTVPDCADIRSFIGPLPGIGGLLATPNFVYWSMQDRAVYRCALPSCSDGAVALGSGYGAVDVNGVAFWWDDGGRLYRSEGRGARADIVDPASELAIPLQPVSDDWRPEKFVDDLAADGGYLYAVLRASSSPRAEATLARWPAMPGGKRDILMTAPEWMERLVVVGGELIWSLDVLIQPDTADGRVESQLESCRVEDCTNTRRTLAPLGARSQSVIADDENIYWVESRVQSQIATDIGIRRTPRLPVPQ
jgi:hypothetical protein